MESHGDINALPASFCAPYAMDFGAGMDYLAPQSDLLQHLLAQQQQQQEEADHQHYGEKLSLTHRRGLAPLTVKTETTEEIGAILNDELLCCSRCYPYTCNCSFYVSPSLPLIVSPTPTPTTETVPFGHSLSWNPQSYPTPTSHAEQLPIKSAAVSCAYTIEEVARKLAETTGTVSSSPCYVESPSSGRQSTVARERRQRIRDRLGKLEKMIPLGGSKYDTAGMLTEATKYVRFLQAQVHLLERMPGKDGKGVLRHNYLSSVLTSPRIQRLLAGSGRCVGSLEQLDALQSLLVSSNRR